MYLWIVITTWHNSFQKRNESVDDSLPANSIYNYHEYMYHQIVIDKKFLSVLLQEVRIILLPSQRL